LGTETGACGGLRATTGAGRGDATGAEVGAEIGGRGVAGRGTEGGTGCAAGVRCEDGTGTCCDDAGGRGGACGICWVFVRFSGARGTVCGSGATTVGRSLTSSASMRGTVSRLWTSSGIGVGIAFGGTYAFVMRGVEPTC